MENEGLIAMPARVRTLSVACGVVVLVGGLLALVGMFLPWGENYYPLDYTAADSPPDPAQPVFHWSPMSYVFGIFHMGILTQYPTQAGFGLACGAVFLAPPLILVALGLRVCVTRQWRAAGGAVAASGAGLAVALLAVWVYTHPVLDDSGTRSRLDVGVAVAVVGFICAIVAGVSAWNLRLDE